MLLVSEAGTPCHIRAPSYLTQPMLVSLYRRSGEGLNQIMAPAAAMATSVAAADVAQSSTQPLSATWQAQNSQHEYMIKDLCVLVDERDSVTGHASKRDVHAFTKQQPRGLLHRAFSVFLFNSENKLLLQQRAASKITFPEVWTNTCCSHQLSGFDPTEIDLPEAVADGSVLGSRLAAVRKLGHELGIPPHQIPLQGFRYLTRLHYCAADPHSAGGNPQWGEHEMDYILFAQADVDVTPHPEEVADVKWVTLPELKELMQPSSGLRWSPWFRILVENHLDGWWRDLRQTLEHGQPQEWTKVYTVTK